MTHGAPHRFESSPSPKLWLLLVAAASTLTAPASAGQGRASPLQAASVGPRVLVPEGSFTMGNDPGVGNRDEWPAHRPVLRPFWIDQREVTNEEYGRCVEQGACTVPASASSKTRPRYYGDPRYRRHPVIQVSWYQAAEYCRFVGGRLPTEAEWEKAARGSKDRRTYPWGEKRPDCTLANFGGPDGCGGDTAATGGRPAGRSPCGADDMAGNVWEWVGDWYDPGYYRRSPSRDPAGPRWGSFKVMRGGCFDTAPDGLRVSCRNHDLPTSAQANVGFRCARGQGGGAR